MPADSFEQFVLDSYYEELGAYYRYMQLAEIADSVETGRIMTGNAQDEYRHAEEFEEAYEDLTGKEPSRTAIHIRPLESGVTFNEILRIQLLEEHGAYQKYMINLKMPSNPCWSQILLDAAQDEFRHTLLDTYLLINRRKENGSNGKPGNTAPLQDLNR